jgi:uncharacterized protein YbbK (DUF523 family)
VYGASACLVGLRTRYDAADALDESVHQLFLEGRVLPLCPEQLGGLSTPRLKATIIGGGGEDVLDGNSAVVLEDGTDVTEHFLRGMAEVLRVARELALERFYLKAGSPSCGIAQSGQGDRPARGNGVCAAALLREGIEIVSV